MEIFNSDQKITLKIKDNTYSSRNSNNEKFKIRSSLYINDKKY